MKKIILIILLLQLDGCKWFSKASLPFYMGTNPDVPEGTPAFQKGWKDGCSSSTYARSNVYYRSKNSYKYDPVMIGNPEYRFGHQRGYAWCFQQSLSGQTGANGSWDRFILPYGYDSTFSSRDINQAWGGMFLGTSGAPLKDNVGGNVGDFVGVFGGSGDSSLFGANPLWAGGSKGQIFGQ